MIIGNAKLFSSVVLSGFITMKSQKKQVSIWTIILIILLLIAVALLVLSRVIDGFALFYATNVYPIWQGTLGRPASLFPFSLSELTIYLVPLLIIINLISVIIKPTGRKIKRFLVRLLFVLSLFFLLYEANCGVNYYNRGFAQSEKIKPVDGEVDKDILVRFCKFTIENLKSDSESRQGTAIYPSGEALEQEAVTAMKKLGEAYPSLSGYYPKPKRILNSRPFSNMEVTGIYSPLFIEANYNGEMPGLNYPFTLCHELSHLKGYMNEGEANYIGWLACMESENQEFNRSAYIISWLYAGSDLYRIDKDLYRELRSSLPDDVIQEIEEDRDFWNNHKTKAAEVQDKVNDSYLKSNGQEAGIQTYNQVVSLMLAWYRDNGDYS